MVGSAAAKHAKSQPIRDDGVSASTGASPSSASPYAPKLNLIERFWKFFKKKVLYNRYYDTFDKFKRACEDFFANAHGYAPQFRTQFTENFEIVGQ